MRSSRLFWKLLAIFGVLSGLLVALVIAGSRNWQARSAAAERARHLTTLARLLGEHLPPLAPVGEDSSELADQVTRWGEQLDLSIVVVNARGEVLATSDSPRDHSPNVLPNNLGHRPEIQNALRHGSAGQDQRWNAASGRWMHYFAIPVERNGQLLGALRLGIEADTYFAQHRLAVSGIALAAWLGGLVLMYFWIGRAVEPLEQLTRRAQAIVAGDEPTEAAYREEDEIGRLGAALDDLRALRIGGQVELREKSDLLAALLGNMVEGVIAVGPDESVLMANAASGRMLGFVASSAAGRALFELTRSRPLGEAVAEAFRTGRAVKRELDAPGEPRRVLAVRAAPLAADARHGVMVVMHDITDLRRLENLRREFVANVSHELKTPLASIKAYAETLRLGAIDDPEHRLGFIGRIEEQSERLHELIVDLLHLARVEAGQAAFELVEIPLAAVADECVYQFADAAAAKGTRLACAPSEPLVVIADEAGLATIFNNLVDNALKYTPAGGEIVVSWERQGDFAVLSVRDSGIGIAPRDQARVFERFFRVDKARSRELGGTGLGLSIVKHLAQAFGGDVGLESQPGVGSTFRVRLPLARTAAAADLQRAAAGGA